MAVIAVTHDVAQDYDTDVNQATVIIECSVVGFHVYISLSRAGVVIGTIKVIDGAPPIQFTAIRHDAIKILLPCGTGTITVNRL